MATRIGGEVNSNGNNDDNGVSLDSADLASSTHTPSSSAKGDSNDVAIHETSTVQQCTKDGIRMRETTARREKNAFSGTAMEASDSTELRKLKETKWASGRALTAHVQDLALRDGKRAMVATSGGSFKKFVCSSETPCSWLVNAVRTRPRARKKLRLNGATQSFAHDKDDNDDASSEENSATHGRATTTTISNDTDKAQGKYWYVSSAYLLHTNCTGMAKPTARQLKGVAALKEAVQLDTKVSLSALVDQLKSQARLLCSKSMVYKAKIDLLDDMEEEEQGRTVYGASSLPIPTATGTDVVVSTQRLPSYLARLSALNPEILHTMERDPTTKDHFYRAVVALDPRRFFSNATPLVFGVDSTRGRPGTAHGAGTQLVLLGCDANLDTITYATAHVPEPSEDHFVWFLSKLVECGYPLQRANGVYCDGRWAITSACGHMGIQCTVQDTRYLIEDLNDAISRQFTAYQHQQGLSMYDSNPALGSEHLVCIWDAQRAETEGEFCAALHKLEISTSALNPNPSASASHLMPDAGMLAAQHLRALNPRRWALFPRLATSKLYGWQTTRFSTSHRQDRSLPLDQSPPDQFHLLCGFFRTFALTLLNETFQRHERAIQWEREQRVVTPEAERMMQEEMKFVPLYDVAMSAPHIAFVWNPQDTPQLRQRRVDLQAKTCTCALRLQFGVPCRHILSVLRKINGLGRSFDYFDDNLRVCGFVAAHRGHHIELPLAETLERDETLLPGSHAMYSSVQERMAVPVQEVTSVKGTATTTAATTVLRKRRVRNKPEDERKRPMYKCRKCSIADGHNSLTCPNRRTTKNP